MLYKSEKTKEHELHLAEQAEQFGLRAVICNAQQVQDYETAVEVNVEGGVLYLDDCHIDSSKFMRTLHQYLLRRFQPTATVSPPNAFVLPVDMNLIHP